MLVSRLSSVMKRIKETRPPPWAANFKPRDKRVKPKYKKGCARCGKAMVGTKKELRQQVYCSAECVPAPLGERWEGLVEKQDGCWLWSGTTNADGYGLIRDGEKMVLAHRVALRLKLRLDDFEGFACHTCDNRRCVNPDHLYIGTHEDNMRDMAVANSGSGSKTTWEERQAMAVLFHQSQDAEGVGAQFGVSAKTVRHWAKVLGPDGVIPQRREHGASLEEVSFRSRAPHR